MLKQLCVIFGIFCSPLTAALAAPTDIGPPRHLIEPDLATAQSISQSQCAALGCDGVETKYWWDASQIQGGRAAVRIHNSSDQYFGASTTVNGVTSGLTNTQIAQLVGSPLQTLGIITADMTVTTDQPIVVLFPAGAKY